MRFKHLSCTPVLRTQQGDKSSLRKSVTCSHLPLQHPKGMPGKKLHLQRLALQHTPPKPKNHNIKHHRLYIYI